MGAKRYFTPYSRQYVGARLQEAQSALERLKAAAGEYFTDTDPLVRDIDTVIQAAGAVKKRLARKSVVPWKAF